LHIQKHINCKLLVGRQNYKKPITIKKNHLLRPTKRTFFHTKRKEQAQLNAMPALYINLLDPISVYGYHHAFHDIVCVMVVHE
jgi:hypothetical protein